MRQTRALKFVLVLLAVLALGGAALALAQSSGPGRAGSEDAQTAAEAVTPEPEGDAAEGVAWDELVDPAAPDEEPSEVTGEDGVTRTGFQYYFVAGSALHPTDQAAGWTRHEGGCVSAENAAVPFVTDLDLPQDSIIEFLRVYYYDAAEVDNGEASIVAYDGRGDELILLDGLASSGSEGYGTRYKEQQTDHQVDNLDYAYVLRWHPHIVGSTMRVCGLRVAYRFLE